MSTMWEKSFEIGVKAIDDEHKAIIDEFSKLYDGMKVGKGHEMYHEVISFLDNYVHTHLIHEELFQQSINYPDYEIHKAKHDEFKLMIQELKDQNIKEVTNEELLRVNILMKNWLVNHILNMDMKIGDFLKEKNS